MAYMNVKKMGRTVYRRLLFFHISFGSNAITRCGVTVLCYGKFAALVNIKGHFVPIATKNLQYKLLQNHLNWCKK